MTSAWLEAGGVLVTVNLRGGLEYAEAWHRDGMGRVKQHVFDDFIAAAETLVRERVTSPAHLVSSGFSNGGLLVAAAMVQRPDLFAAVICDQPLTEMVRFATRMHARKFAAALQAATHGGPALLRVQWNVGHVGGDSRPAYAEKIAQEYAFAMRFAR